MAALPNDIYFGGGRLYLEDRDTGDWEEVCLVQSLSLKSTSSTDEVMDYSEALPQIFDEILTKLDYSIDFTTKQVNVQTLSKAFLADIETGVDNPLVDGIQGATKVTKMTLGKAQQYQGKVKFESENIRGKKILIFLHKVSLKPDTDLSLIGDKAAEIKFSGKAGKGADGEVGYQLRAED